MSWRANGAEDRFMRLVFATAIAVVCSVVGSAAQDAQPPDAIAPIHAPGRLPAGALFISPMGQPFRATAEQPAPPILAWKQAADTNNDGKLSPEEFIAQGVVFFTEVLDANRDGLATSSESTTLWRSEAPEMLTGEAPVVRPPPRERRRPEPRNDGRVPVPVANPFSEREPPSAMQRFGITNDREPVMSCDVDLNRRVTEEEFRACAERRFAALDANGDGFFEIAESERARTLAAR
jgi:hypothetical protein